MLRYIELLKLRRNRSSKISSRFAKQPTQMPICYVMLVKHDLSASGRSAAW